LFPSAPAAGAIWLASSPDSKKTKAPDFALVICIASCSNELAMFESDRAPVRSRLAL